MTDFLLELRSEEIPARMQAKAREDLARLFASELEKVYLTAADIVTYATPRRLALIARGLPDATAATVTDIKGPPADAPAAAIEGFLRKLGNVARDVLETRTDAKGRPTLYAVLHGTGRRTDKLLPGVVETIIRQFPWPKAMRWGDASASTESPRWVRPLHGIVALFGDAIVPCEAAGVTSGATTKGHRFHHPGDITIGGAHDYVEKLRACHVIVDQAERTALIAREATTLTAAAGLTLIRDDGLLAENAGLTEWPVPLLGRFDAAFLDVPPEVIQLTARVNQKYFVCNDAAGNLANAFVCVANIAAADGGAKIVEGNRKVLAARLSDARFFYDTDLKTKLEDQLPKLEKIVFHEKLGTVADKVERVAQLARWLVEEGIVTSSPLPSKGGAGGGSDLSAAPAATHPPTPVSGRSGSQPDLNDAGHRSPKTLGREGELADLAERAARLAKADLVTGMVGEFPELQGLIGGYYAAAQGEDPQVAAAIRDHYKPVGQGDDVPTDPVTVAVSLADKLDTLFSFFAIDEKPTGSKDPFALRRAAVAVIALVMTNDLRLGLRSFVPRHMSRLLWQQYDRSQAEQVSHRLQRMGPNPDARGAFLILPDEYGEEADTFERLVAFVGAASEATRDVLTLKFGNDLDQFLAKALNGVWSLLDFFADRLKVQQREAGVRHDLIDAVFALGGEDDLVRLLARVRALQAFVGTADGANLLAGYKRAANILKKEGYAGGKAQFAPLPGREGPGVGDSPERDAPASNQPTDPSLKPGREEKPLSYTPEIAETALIAALDTAEPAAAQAVAAEDFEAAMTALATLRAPIDAFFEGVTVNDPAPEKREARLALLARVRDAVHNVADFSKIEG